MSTVVEFKPPTAIEEEAEDLIARVAAMRLPVRQADCESFPGDWTFYDENGREMTTHRAWYRKRCGLVGEAYSIKRLRAERLWGSAGLVVTAIDVGECWLPEPTEKDCQAWCDVIRLARRYFDQDEGDEPWGGEAA